MSEHMRTVRDKKGESTNFEINKTNKSRRQYK